MNGVGRKITLTKQQAITLLTALSEAQAFNKNLAETLTIPEEDNVFLKSIKEYKELTELILRSELLVTNNKDGE